jgi:hypothetical protein
MKRRGSAPRAVRIAQERDVADLVGAAIPVRDQEARRDGNDGGAAAITDAGVQNLLSADRAVPGNVSGAELGVGELALRGVLRLTGVQPHHAHAVPLGGDRAEALGVDRGVAIRDRRGPPGRPAILRLVHAHAVRVLRRSDAGEPAQRHARSAQRRKLGVIGPVQPEGLLAHQGRPGEPAVPGERRQPERELAGRRALEPHQADATVRPGPQERLLADEMGRRGQRTDVAQRRGRCCGSRG